MKRLTKTINVKNPFPILLILVLFFTACPDPPETTECGANQVKVNGDCECEEGYHWNENQTKCLMETTSHNFTWKINTRGIAFEQLV